MKSVTVNGRTFEGDERRAGEPGGFRTQQIVTIETDPSKGPEQVSLSQTSGPSHELNSKGEIIGQGTASGETFEMRVSRYESGVVTIQAKGNEANPLIAGAPGITYDFVIRVESKGPQGDLSVTVSGTHDKFPGYEIMVNRPETTGRSTLVYNYDPSISGNSGWALTGIPLLGLSAHKINPPANTVVKPPAQPAQPAKPKPPTRPKKKRAKGEQ